MIFDKIPVYTGVSVSQLFGYRDPPLVIRYPNKLYPNYLIQGVSITELVRIPRPQGGLGIRTQKNTDSLSEQIFSELVDPRGLDIRTQKNADSLSEQILSELFDLRAALSI